MSRRIACPSCNFAFGLTTQQPGDRIICPGCRQPITVSIPESLPPPPSLPPTPETAPQHQRATGSLFYVAVGAAVLAVVITSYFLFRGNSSKSDANVNRTPVASVSAPKFFLEYDENALAADQKYGGKFIEVTGRVRIVGKDGSGRYFVGMECIAFMPLDQRDYDALPARERRWFSEGTYPPNLIGFIDPPAEKQFANVKQSQVVKIIGKVLGRKSNPDVWHDYIVELADCRLATEPTN